LSPFIFTLALLALPVIHLDEVYVEGSIRKPSLIELKKSHLPEAIEKAALSNLIRLEKKLTRPLLVKEFQGLSSAGVRHRK